ncbi:MAG: hypothetical protein NZM04_09500 [Methylacidiphilales bacterium]|nr:hypothetical protein [Candidatus Methylacidiphilales bacterium]MDW8348765.1 hypothetical protein [Verrucomicrobiae bacterium]
MFAILGSDPIRRAERDLRLQKRRLAREARKKQLELIYKKKIATHTKEKLPTWKMDVSLESFIEDQIQEPPHRQLRKTQYKERKELFILFIAFCLLTWLALWLFRRTLG